MLERQLNGNSALVGHAGAWPLRRGGQHVHAHISFPLLSPASPYGSFFPPPAWVCDAACWRPEGRAVLCATIHPQTHDAFRELYGAVKSSFYGGWKSILMTSTYLPAACALTRVAECRTQRALPDKNLILGHHNKSRRSCGSSLRSLAFLRGSALCCCNKSVGNVYSFTVGSFFFVLSCSAGGPSAHSGFQHI